MNRPIIISDKNNKSLKIKRFVKKCIQDKEFRRAGLVIVIGGDGFMLQTLKKSKRLSNFYYGINSGNYGFLMNKFSKKHLIKNLNRSKVTTISPLEMKVFNKQKIRKYR